MSVKFELSYTIPINKVTCRTSESLWVRLMLKAVCQHCHHLGPWDHPCACFIVVVGNNFMDTKVCVGATIQFPYLWMERLLAGTLGVPWMMMVHMMTVHSWQVSGLDPYLAHSSSKNKYLKDAFVKVSSEVPYCLVLRFKYTMQMNTRHKVCCCSHLEHEFTTCACSDST